MDLGCMLMTGTDPWLRRSLRLDELRQMATIAEGAGVDAILVPDHLHWVLDEATVGFWEGTTVAAAIASATNRITISTGVVNMPFRHPGLLAKLAVTLDEISGGRFELGLGAGAGYPSDYTSFGFPTDHRYSRFEEAIQIIHALLRTGSIDHAGTFYSAHLELIPEGPRPNQIPIVVAAKGPKMMRLAARYADGWNFYAFLNPTPEHFRPMLDDLDRACEAEGRDPSTLRRSVLVLIAPTGITDMGPTGYGPPITGTPERIAAQLHALAAVGIDRIDLSIWPNTIESFEALAPVVEAVRDTAG